MRHIVAGYPTVIQNSADTDFDLSLSGNDPKGSLTVYENHLKFCAWNNRGSYDFRALSLKYAKYATHVIQIKINIQIVYF